MELEKDYEVHYYEIDCDKKLSLNSILNYLQDIFVYQVKGTGICFDYVDANKVSWVICKWNINMISYPTYGEKVKIKMKILSYIKCYMWEKFIIFNEKGEKIGEAVALLSLINLIERKPCNITADHINRYKLADKERKLTAMEKIKPIKKVDYERDFMVRYSDIDTNNHVNNVTYLMWAFDILPKYILSGYEVNNLKIKYGKEVVYGQEITSKVQIINKPDYIESIHYIVDKNSDVVARLESKWVKKDYAVLDVYTSDDYACTVNE